METNDLEQALQWVAEFIEDDGAAVLVNPYMECKIVHSVEEAKFIFSIEYIVSVLPV